MTEGVLLDAAADVVIALLIGPLGQDIPRQTVRKKAGSARHSDQVLQLAWGMECAAKQMFPVHDVSLGLATGVRVNIV